MKSNRAWLAPLAAVLLVTSGISTRAEDWKTTDGKVYQDVKVIASKPDAVTILHHDGGALVPLANLPVDLQKRFNYDPAKAKAAATARKQGDAENARALQAEMDLASQMRQAGPEPQDADASETGSASTDDATARSATAVSGEAGHHSLGELESFMQTLKLDSSDTTHHSMDELTLSSAAMRRDLSDPTYHTMAHLAYSIHSLGPDPSDPNHHSMSEITDSGL